MNRIRVCIVYPADPAGHIIGGVHTAIKGVIAHAPEAIRFSMIGVTTDARARPPGQVTVCRVRGQRVDFFPLFHERRVHQRHGIPLSLRFVLALAGRPLPRHAEVFQFHRVEPALLFAGDPRPRVFFVHQNPADIAHRRSDIRWKHAPGLYRRVEEATLGQGFHTFCVRRDAVAVYEHRFPHRSSGFSFLPTWADPLVFYPRTAAEKDRLRRDILEQAGWGPDSMVFAWAGRLDRQKDPLVLAEAFARLCRSLPLARLVVAGQGVATGAFEHALCRAGLADRVWLAGTVAPARLSEVMAAAHVFVLSSAYEGMPRVVIEALACGTPVAATNVGEVGRLIRPGENGSLARPGDAQDLARAMTECARHHENRRGRPCLDVAEAFTPARVLAPVYRTYVAAARAGKEA